MQIVRCVALLGVAAVAAKAMHLCYAAADGQRVTAIPAFPLCAHPRAQVQGLQTSQGSIIIDLEGMRSIDSHTSHRKQWSIAFPCGADCKSQQNDFRMHHKCESHLRLVRQ